MRIQQQVDPYLEMTEISDRTLRAKGPALLFENPKGYKTPVLCNLFGTPERVALGMGEDSVHELREIGKLLAFLKEPEPPKGLKDAWNKLIKIYNMPGSLSGLEEIDLRIGGKIYLRYDKENYKEIQNL